LKRRFLSLDEVNAYRSAYGNPFLKKELFAALIAPFFVAGFYVMILTYYWWLALIGGVIGALYGFFVLIKQSVKRVYDQQAIQQRNRFVNNMPHILSNKDETVFSAIKWCARPEISKGEFKRDLDILLGNLMDATDEDIKMAFEEFSDKYKSDIPFTLFIEHLVTAMLEGNINVKKLKEITSMHNDMLYERNLFVINKSSYLKQLKMFQLYAIAIIGILTFADGFKNYLINYAHNPIGWICSAVFLVVLAFLYHGLQVKMSDDEVMELKVWRN